MSITLCELDFNEKIEYVSLSTFEWSQNLMFIGFKNRIVVGTIKFQEDFDDVDQKVEFEPVEEFYHGQRVHAVSWSSKTSLLEIPRTIEICVASSDFCLRILSSDVSTKHHSRKEIQGHLDYINDCAFDPEGDYLVSVSDDLSCKLWSVNRQFQLIRSFSLTSPGISVAWKHEDPGKFLVGEKQGIIRLYNATTLQPLNCIMSGLDPLTGISTSYNSKLIIILAAGELLATNINMQTIENRMVHPYGRYKMACCPNNENYVATVGRPNSTLIITNLKTKRMLVNKNLEMFGGFSWHYRLPYLCVGNNSKLTVFKILLK